MSAIGGFAKLEGLGLCFGGKFKTSIDFTKVMIVAWEVVAKDR